MLVIYYFVTALQIIIRVTILGIGKTNKEDEKKSKPVMTVTAGFAPVSDLNNVQPSETGEPPAPKFSPLFVKKDKMELQEKM